MFLLCFVEPRFVMRILLRLKYFRRVLLGNLARVNELEILAFVTRKFLNLFSNASQIKMVSANWFPCFKENRHRPLQVLLLVSVRMISNHPAINYCIEMSEIMSFAISFLSCFFSFFVNTCRSNHTHVGASSFRDISHGPN